MSSSSQSNQVSIVSRSFWISFLNYYIDKLMKITVKTKNKSYSILINYGFDFLLFSCAYLCFRDVIFFKKEIGKMTVKGNLIVE